MAALAPKTEVAALADRLTALSSQVKTFGDSARADISALAARVASTPQSGTPQSGGAQPSGQPSVNETETDAALQAQVAALDGRIDGIAQAAQEARALAGAAGDQVKTLDTAVRAIDPAQIEAAARSAGQAVSQANELEAKLGALARQVAAGSNDPRVTALIQAVAATDALTAIRNGRPLSRETASLAAGGDAGLKQGGYATLAKLQYEFSTARDRLAALQHQNEGVLDRLGASASRLVRVRPVDAEGQPIAAAEGSVDRVSDLLAAGDLAGAETAWRALPQTLRDAAPAFGAALTARVNAERAARSAINAALASMAGSSPAAAPAVPASAPSAPAGGSRP